MSTKYIQVLLKKDLNRLGERNSLITVKAGFARNYLLPNKLAHLATPGLIKQAQKMAELENQKQLETQQLVKTTQEKFNQVGKITLKRKVGKSNLIFGTITEKEIASALSSILGTDISKKQVFIPEIKNTGLYSIQIQLQKDSSISLSLQVVPTSI